MRYQEYLNRPDKFFNYSISNYCNLNCIGCRTHSPITKHWNCDLDIFKKDMETLLKIFPNKDIFINLFGGEPLTNPYIDDIIKECPFRIGMLTNGKALQFKNNDFYKLLKEYNVWICISRYSFSKINYDLIFKKLNDFNIEFEKFGYENSEGKRNFLISKNDPNGNYDLIQQFEHCVSVTPIIQNGKLFKCVIQNVEALNEKFGTNFKLIEDKDYLVLDKIISHQQILEWIKVPIPFCRFCGSDGVYNENKLVDWKPSKLQKSEWILEPVKQTR